MVRNSQVHTWKKMGFYRHRDGGTQRHHTLQCGFIEQKKNLFRTIHSANQLSICGAVSSWSEEFAQRTPKQKESASEKFARTENEQLLNNVEPQEVNCSVQTPRSDNRESGNRLRECLQRRETLEKEIQFSKVCEDATIARRVSTGMSYKTVPDVDDGFGDRTPACREYTLPREDQNSRIYATIPGQTMIGPVLQAHILRHLGISGLEIQIPSTTTKNRTYWLVICRGKNPLRGRVTSQWSRPQSHKFWTAIGKICCKRKRTWFDKDGAIIEHRGNSCETVENSDESSVQLFRRISSYRGKEVARHSSLSTTQRKHFWSRSLKIGHEIGSWRAQILGLWLASAYLQKKQQNEAPTLQEFQTCLIVHSCYSRTQWWEPDSARVDGSRRYSKHMERIPVASRMLSWCHFNPQIRTHRCRTSKQRRKTDHLLHTSQPTRAQSGRRRTWRWPLQAETNTLLQQVGTSSGRCLLDQLSSGTRQRTTVLTNQNPCRNCIQLCASRLHLQSDVSKREKWHLKDSRRLVLHRRQYSRVTHRRVLLQAPRNWCVKRNKVPQQTTQNHRASGNRCEVLSHLLRKRSLNFKSTSELKDLHRMWS